MNVSSWLINWIYSIYCNLWNCLLQEGARIVPLISSKQLSKLHRLFSFTIENNYIPLRFNQAGVMPIILTTAVLVIPNYITNLGLVTHY